MTFLFGVLLLSSIFWVPFFGTQAVRLLRESWGGILRKDPEGDYVEKGAAQLAEELYAMFDDNIPQTQNAPVTMNLSNPAGPGFTINNPAGGNSFNVNGGNTSIGGNTNNGDTISIGGGTFNNATNTFDFGGNTITINKDGITFGNPPPLDSFCKDNPNASICQGLPPLPPVTFNNPVTFNDAPTGPDGKPIGGGGDGGGGGNVFLGKVTGGSGNTYTVEIYGNGSSGGATGTVSATVPQIDSTETIPAGTWIAAVHAFGTTDEQGNVSFTYEFQPPVFMFG